MGAIKIAKLKHKTMVINFRKSIIMPFKKNTLSPMIKAIMLS
jgi:hypothetical protein